MSEVATQVEPLYSWDRQPGETQTQYEQFLCYLGMGPSRTIRGAFRHYCVHYLNVPESEAPSGPNGGFKATTIRWRWAERANDHDIHILREEGRSVISSYLKGLFNVAAKAAQASEEAEIDDPRWPVILKSLEFVGEQLRPVRESGMLGMAPAPTVQQNVSDQEHPGPVTAPAPSRESVL